MKKYNVVISYATRPMRDGEENGKQHIFISQSEAEELIKNEELIAYTEIGEYKYFATKSQLADSNIYIIDPKGIKYIKENFPEIKTKVIYIYAPKFIRDERAAKNRSDYDTKYAKRCKEEDEQFSEFENNSLYDTRITNIDFELSSTLFNKYLGDNYDEDTLFLVAGRTCSGKDSLVSKALEILNNE